MPGEQCVIYSVTSNLDRVKLFMKRIMKVFRTSQPTAALFREQYPIRKVLPRPNSSFRASWPGSVIKYIYKSERRLTTAKQEVRSLGLRRNGQLPRKDMCGG